MKPAFKKVSMNFDPELFEKAKIYCIKNDINLTELVHLLVKSHLNLKTKQKATSLIHAN